MAEIKGITLKGLTRFVGMEGEAYQGNIYMDGKKIGWFSQSGDGGCSTIDYNNPEIKKVVDKRIEQYFKENPPDVDWANTDEFFYEDLVNLILNEKEFKKAIKKGYVWYMTVSTVFNPDDNSRPYKVPKAYFIPQGCTSDKEMKKLIADLKAEGYDKIKIYKSLEDFVIK